ncbi:MAG TPA: hypothetical protein VKP30_03640 [Polyangiaceae bacterium]|nr:hypothetical protein [Polyangiaceae bacterium]
MKVSIHSRRTSSPACLALGFTLAGLFGLGCTDSVDSPQDKSVGGTGVGVGGSKSSVGGATTSTSTARPSGGSSGNAGGTTATTGTSPSTGGSSGGNAGSATTSAGTSSAVSGGAAGSAAGGSAGTAGAAGGTGKGCYSPVQNTAHAYERDAVGCVCDPVVDVSVCVQGVALLCISGYWESVYDGPCMPRPQTKYSPATCTQAGGTPVASPGTPITAEKDCASGNALGIIDTASSGWDEGGLCCAPVKACGARAGDTCTTTQYCAYQAGQYCGAADAEATCKTRPTACVELNAPVCGCNGKTYGNTCLAAAAGIGVYANGKCTN